MRLWKCDLMNAGQHLFSLGLWLRGVFMKKLTRFKQRGNEDGHFSYRNEISTT